MRIACVLTASELTTSDAELIVLPEGASQREIEQVQLSYPDAMTVGGMIEHGNSCGVLWHKRKNRIAYVKVGNDGRTRGGGDLSQMPLYEFGNVCIGVLMCMDIDNVIFSQAVIDNIRSSPEKLKLLCIPADMGDHWFNDNNSSALQRFQGMHVILCNHTKTHQARCKSFITDTHGRKMAVQQSHEALYAELL